MTLETLTIRGRLQLFAVLVVVSFSFFAFALIGQMNVIVQPVVEDIPEGIETLSDVATLESYMAQIQYLDEVLTQSARNFAFTGDEKWVDRYSASEEELAALIVAADGLLASTPQSAAFSNLDEANGILVELESRSIEARRNGDTEQAIALLEGDQYSQNKAVYSDALDRLVTYQAEVYDSALIGAFSTLEDAADQATTRVRANRRYAIVSTVTVLVFLIAISLIVGRSIVEPIKTLLGATKKVRDGDLAVDLEGDPRTELGTLALSFNEMTDVVQRSRSDLEQRVDERTKELEESKEILDQKVAERTKELQEAKDMLDVTVEERTKELQDQLEQIERINSAMVGREQKMIELKQRIAELEKEG